MEEQLQREQIKDLVTKDSSVTIAAADHNPLRSYRHFFSAHCDVGPFGGSPFARKLFPTLLLERGSMGGGDRCAVYNCDNARRFKDK